MRLGLLLLAALCCGAAAHECLVGNLLVSENVITSRSVEYKECSGLCRKQTIKDGNNAIVLLSCEDNKLEALLNQEGICDVNELETSCFCSGARCNNVALTESIVQPVELDLSNNITCFVGFAANNSFSTGDVVQCSSGNACTKVNGTYMGYDAEIYACMPQTVCQQIFPSLTSGTQCASLNSTNIQGCCCYDSDCRSLVTFTDTLPTPQPFGKNNVSCWSGITLNGVVYYNGGFSQCAGECGSARIRTVYNSQTVWGEVFVCDPVNVFTGLNIDNQCKTIDTANVNGVPTGLITGCACNTDKCLDPTVFPPVYPIKQLKCAVGLSNGTTWLGAEMNCNGRCGRVKFNVAGQPMSYYMCAPYDLCAGFGLESSEGVTYNPPQDEDIEVYCCSAWNNCNVDDPSIARQVNTSAVSTANYPVLCYGGVWVNGVAITNPAYGLCQGECASASFTTNIAGQQHNATLYTCDPVTMCSQAGIRSGCGTIFGSVTACCCDNDLCLDPQRGAPPPGLRCYSGISSSDGYNQGGDQFCDGWCGSLNSFINGRNVTAYFCAPVPMCRYFGLGFGGNGNCAPIVGADPPVSGCCCSEGDNCLAPPGVNVTAIPARRDPKIVCYEGLHINGDNATRPYYRICDGECVSIQMGGTINGTTHFATLYTCDASSSCAALGIRNNCSLVDNSLSTCCCDSDECIDPTVGRVPGTPLYCYVGLKTLYGNISAGAEVQCNGYCASVSGVVGSDVVTAFACAPRSLCRSLGLDNSNSTLYVDRMITAACCDYAPYCNTVGYNVNISGLTPVTNESPKACYSGVFVNYTAVSNGGWTACQGDCVAVNLNTTLNGQTVPGSLYTCDPTIICRQLNTTNRCNKLEDGLEACCCDTDACLDPTVYPPRRPFGEGNLCYVGVYSYDSNGRTIANAGGEEYCSGTCSSLSSSINGNNVTVYACVPNYVCSYLALYDNCQTLSYDRDFTGCCCSSGPNCNLDQIEKRPPPAPRQRPRREYPITCPAGVILNGAPVTPVQFTVCDGDCVSMSINASLGNATHVATLYTCDPSSVCQQLNITNSCGSPEPGLTGCCCDTDACLDPSRNKTVPTPPLKCYVGVYSAAAKSGAEILCDGKCASISANVNNDTVNLFACVPHSVCRSLELYDDCARMGPPYPEFDACCCDNTDNCNVALAHRTNDINTTIPLSPLNDYPITCYSGLFLNGTAYSDGGWQSCQGECASVSLTSSFRGVTGTATLYTCDPSRVCRTLGIVNNCTTLENGVTGCCCNSPACLNPTVFPARTPGNPLMCYAGVSSNYTYPDGRRLEAGQQIQCDGKCSALEGIVNGYKVFTYHCVPDSICRGLELYDNCASPRRLHEDRQVQACCCDNYNNCNVQDPNIRIPDPSKNVDYAIACYSGVYVNGTAITDVTLGACQGQCASITLQTTYLNVTVDATVYGCDPTLVCEVLGMENTCASPEPGLSGCCCNTDLCLDPPKGKTVPSGYRNCFVGIYANGTANGGEVSCNGKCASLSSRVNNDDVTVFACVPTQICRQLELYDECHPLSFRDRDIQSCCCDNYDNCNVDLAGLGTKINTTKYVPPSDEYPITCYSGVFINGQPIADAGWQSCQGECASATISTVFQNQLQNASLYTCDPTRVCRNLGVVNNCTTIEAGLTGCCCNTNGCLDPTTTPPKQPGNALTCYVGLRSTYQDLNVGAETLCDGKCASLTGVVAGQNVTTYHCVSNAICQYLEINNNCRPLYQDRQVEACCCDKENNCNVKDPSIHVGPARPTHDFPIACYNGLLVNNTPITDITLSGCYGQCASVSLTTLNFNNQSLTATLLTCDPTAVCEQLNMTNSCASPEWGVSGCCCNTDGCINPYTNTYPGPLNCYVGIYTSDGKVNNGSSVPCDGYCGSLETKVGDHLYKSYHCVPKSICTNLELNNNKRSIWTDREIKAGCCTTHSNCNVEESAVNVTNADPFTGTPIACRQAIYVNGVSYTGDYYTACAGQCASVTYNTQFQNNNHTLTYYTCDPTAVCTQLNLNNNCATIDDSVSGCCCSTDNCLGPNVFPTTPSTGSSGTLTYLTCLLAAVYIALVGRY